MIMCVDVAAGNRSLRLVPAYPWHKLVFYLSKCSDIHTKPQFSSYEVLKMGNITDIVGLLTYFIPFVSISDVWATNKMNKITQDKCNWTSLNLYTILKFLDGGVDSLVESWTIVWNMFEVCSYYVPSCNVAMFKFVLIWALFLPIWLYIYKVYCLTGSRIILTYYNI